MRTITVLRDEFIERVTKNRNNHRAVFEEALEGYRIRLTAELDLQGGPEHEAAELLDAVAERGHVAISCFVAASPQRVVQETVAHKGRVRLPRSRSSMRHPGA